MLKHTLRRAVSCADRTGALRVITEAGDTIYQRSLRSHGPRFRPSRRRPIIRIEPDDLGELLKGTDATARALRNAAGRIVWLGRSEGVFLSVDGRDMHPHLSPA